MRKVIAIINMTVDGLSDHTILQPDEEVHHHYTELLNDAGAILYGRVTYELMKYWQALIENPSAEKSMNDFAKAIDKIPKMVFSNTLKDVEWDSAKLMDHPIEKEVLILKQQPGNHILVGSKSLIMQLLDLNLIDELQLCVHPVVAGKGTPLFEQIKDRTVFKLLKTKAFRSGAIILYYEPINNS